MTSPRSRPLTPQQVAKALEKAGREDLAPRAETLTPQALNRLARVLRREGISHYQEHALAAVVTEHFDGAVAAPAAFARLRTLRAAILYLSFAVLCAVASFFAWPNRDLISVPESQDLAIQTLWDVTSVSISEKAETATLHVDLSRPSDEVAANRRSSDLMMLCDLGANLGRDDVCLASKHPVVISFPKELTSCVHEDCGSVSSSESCRITLFSGVEAAYCITPPAEDLFVAPTGRRQAIATAEIPLTESLVTWNSNGASTVVSLPSIEGLPDGVPITITTSAAPPSGVQWATGPSPRESQREWIWQYRSQLSPVVSTGSDPVATSQDQRNTFIAGVLAGLAGSFAVAAIQSIAERRAGRSHHSARAW